VATGAGGVSRQVLGTVVIGGMLAATVVAVFLIPVTFSVVERVTHLFGKNGGATLDSLHAPEHAVEEEQV
jgi:HAE1 family hydrophobic/amphiphilic exporter-1